ncbi:MAG: FAD-dependent oxidoreductase [Anaerolineaceae bacterium]|nr:FAD-dependent oxidoreductase [Anaerolineaceae bacterium]
MTKHIPYAAEYHPERRSPILLEFANHINKTKMGKKGGISYDDPEYFVMEHIVSDEAAAVGMGLTKHIYRTAEEVAQILGKPLDYVQKYLDELSDAGAAFFRTLDGKQKYWLEVWVPGHMEAIANHPVNGLKYPEIGIAFDAYGKKKGPLSAAALPMGMTPMRVIPIESAIKADSRHASYEEVSHYLNENTIFSVSNCSCRTVRESMGEGCGHIKEDMCIQMGHGAEYYIRTGRARQITREEAFAIIKKAEENGLMHDIPNMDGSGKTHAICNCCGCGCLAIRNANMFQNPNFSRSNYQAKVDPLKCVACGECVENCPVNALRLGQKLCSTVELPKMPLHLDNPTNTKWGVERWNPEYRTNRKVVMESGTSPCKSKCPAHIGVQGYVKMAAQGRFRDALELIKLENPFPAVCGHVCPRYCEQACTRGKLDEAVAVDDIKRFIAEQDMKSEHRYVPKKKHDFSDKKIAIIGAGPAGLSCAYYLAIDNYDVTVFEKENQLGGMLTWGIPNFRLERDVINSEIDVLKELGVKFQTGVDVGKDVSLDDLRKQGYKGFYLAIGAQAGRKLGIEGEDAADVKSGVDFLRRVNQNEEKMLHGKTIVIGGGNVAIDVARTAVRAGGKDVTMFCLEQRAEMPALPEEIHEAISEGIGIENGWGPKRIVVENDKVKGVEFKLCTRVFDEEHRFSPQFDESQTRFVEAEHVLTSVGQAIDWGNLLKGSKVELNRNQTVKADPITFQTAEEDIFVGGDALTGPKFAIDAIAQGKEGAISLHRFVQHGQSLTLGRLLRDYRPLDQENLDLAGFDSLPRQRVEEVEGEKSRETFRDLRKSLTLEQIEKEAARCLSCGAVQVDTYQCIGCGQCTVRCHFEAISLERVTDIEGVHISKLKPIVIKNMLKNKANIMVHSIKKTISGVE